MSACLSVCIHILYVMDVKGKINRNSPRRVNCGQRIVCLKINLTHVVIGLIIVLFEAFRLFLHAFFDL